MGPEATTRERILEQARDVFLETGMAGFSMRAVARRTGLTATAIYRHFENKEALLMAVAQAGFERFGQYLYRGLQGKTPRERLELTGRGYVRFALEQRGYYRVMFMSLLDDLGFEKMPAENQERFSPTFQFLVDRVRECQGAGVLRNDDPVKLAVTIWSLSHGLASLYLTGHFDGVGMDDGAFEAFHREASARLVDGLSP